jgi:glycosyltransferase involved in cell wall biosynthesis
MSRELPTVSILLPLYNGALTVKNALKSIVSQAYGDYEIIVIDDCSNDTGVQVVVDFFAEYPEINSKVITLEKNSGSVQVPLVTGCQTATGKYIARIDDDDSWSDSDKLKKQVEFLESHPEYVLVGTGVILVDEEGEELSRYLSPETDFEIRNQLLKRNCFAHPSVVFVKSVMEQVGGYSLDPKKAFVEDYDLWLRMGQHGNMANLPCYGITSIVSSESESGKNKLTQLWRDLLLSCSYRKQYPKSFYAVLFAAIRFLVYLPYSLLPKDLKTRINSMYKSSGRESSK